MSRGLRTILVIVGMLVTTWAGDAFTPYRPAIDQQAAACSPGHPAGNGCDAAAQARPH